MLRGRRGSPRDWAAPGFSLLNATAGKRSLVQTLVLAVKRIKALAKTPGEPLRSRQYWSSCSQGLTL